PVPDRARAHEVQPQRGLTHTRAGGDDDHLSRVQPVGDLVELAEAGRHAGGETAAGGDRIDLVERGLEQFLQRRVVLGGAAFGDLVYLGLGAVDDLVDLLAVGAVV